MTIMPAPVSPLEGVYTISATPTMKAPPIHVATGETHKRSHVVNRPQLFGKRTKGWLMLY